MQAKVAQPRILYALAATMIVLAFALGGCQAGPPGPPPPMDEGPTAPPTVAAPTATPNVVATSAAVATVVAEEETAVTETAASGSLGGAADLPEEITSHLWRLEQMAGADGALAPLVEGTAITAEWGSGSIRGETPCNAYRGPYLRQPDGTITVQEVRLTPLGLGNLGCDAASPETDQDAAYVDALYKGAVYATDEAGKLQISTAEGDPVLVFATDVP